MLRAAAAEARAFDSWSDYQAALIRAIAPLSAEQLGRRLIAGQRTPGELAEHIVFGRALHLSRTLREPGPLGQAAAALAPLTAWERPANPPRTADELVQGLEQTWLVIRACLLRGEPSAALSEEAAQELQTIWGLLDHDLPHAGELSLLLGAAGCPGVEL